MSNEEFKIIGGSFSPINIEKEYHECSTSIWENRLKDSNMWLKSELPLGVRVDFSGFGTCRGPNGGRILSKYVRECCKHFNTKLGIGDRIFISAMLYSPELSLNEIRFFFRMTHPNDTKKRNKYLRLWDESNYGEDTKIWPFPGRSFDFMFEIPKSLRLYCFDYVNLDKPYEPYELRQQILKYLVCDSVKDFFEYVPSEPFLSVEDLIENYTTPITLVRRDVLQANTSPVQKKRWYLFNKNKVCG